MARELEAEGVGAVTEQTGKKTYPQLQYVAPPGSTEILLVRHGSSMAFDPDGPSFPLMPDGQGDPPLAPEGHEQAELVGARLASEPITAIYVTTLQRTVQTAAPLVEATGLSPIVEPGLREIFLGEWEGGRGRQIMGEGTHPIALEVMRTGSWDSVPGAETQAEFRPRCLEALARIHADNPDGKVVAFSHGGVIGAVVNELLGLRESRWLGVGNTSITHLVYDGDNIAVRSMNDSSHIGGLFS